MLLIISVEVNVWLEIYNQLRKNLLVNPGAYKLQHKLAPAFFFVDNFNMSSHVVFKPFYTLCSLILLF